MSKSNVKGITFSFDKYLMTMHIAATHMLGTYNIVKRLLSIGFCSPVHF
jgi:hypothetical protein